MEEESIIGTLCESRLIRNKQMIETYNARDIADLIFLYFIILTILKKDFAGAPIAGAYAKHAIRFGNWDDWRFAYNDLGALIFTLFGKNKSAVTLKDPEASEMLMKRMSFDETLTKQWLRDVVRGIDRSNRDRRFLLNLERKLAIDNTSYKAIRRLASEWTTLSKSQRRLITTRLLQALRVRARKSELLRIIEAMARSSDLEIKGANNAELDKNGNPIEDKRSKALKRAAAAAGITLGGVAGIFTAKRRADAKAAARRASYVKKVN